MKPIRLAFPITRGLPASALPLSEETARTLFSAEELTAGEGRLSVKTEGPWGLLRSVSGLAIETDQTPSLVSPYCPSYAITDCVIYGPRTISRPRQNGHAVEGLVSIRGKKRRAFTGSIMFRLPDGRLLSAPVLHVC